jgi:FkbM family methyltransferase
MIEKLKARFIGGYSFTIVKIYYRCIVNSRGKDLKNVFHSLFNRSLYNYFFGRKSFEEVKYLKKVYSLDFFKNEVWDFEFFKINRLDFTDFHMFMVEANDLLFPYIARKAKDYDFAKLGEGTYERFGVEIFDGDVVIDCGANIGMFSLFAANKNASRVISFEPVHHAFDLLDKNIYINDFNKTEFIVEKFGLSNDTAKVKISINDKNVGSNSIIGYIDSQKAELIDVIKLDDYIRNNKINKIDFIKADIEGAERLMLEGARETKFKLKPKLSICTYHFPDDVEVLTKIILEANSDYKIYYGHKKLYAI